MAPTSTTAWDDSAWEEAADTPWAAGCRWLQAWWRKERLSAPPGPHRVSDPDRLVASMLPVDGWHDANFLNADVVAAVEQRLGQHDAGGLINPDRLRRNLLSSQPLCFNLFGYLAHHPDLVARWLRSIGCDAVEVTTVKVESAPVKEKPSGGGAAFDAFVEYRRTDGSASSASRPSTPSTCRRPT